MIGRDRKPNPDSPVTYSNQVARILNANCVFCHREGQIAPFSLTSYEEVAGWAGMIDEVVQAQRMPPWHADPRYGHFANDRRMTKDEIETLQQRIDGQNTLIEALRGDAEEVSKLRAEVRAKDLEFERVSSELESKKELVRALRRDGDGADDRVVSSHERERRDSRKI